MLLAAATCGAAPAEALVFAPAVNYATGACPGSIAPATPRAVDYGATPKSTFAPDSGCHVGTVTVDGVPVAMTGTDANVFPAVSAEPHDRRGARGRPQAGDEIKTSLGLTWRRSGPRDVGEPLRRLRHR